MFVSSSSKEDAEAACRLFRHCVRSVSESIDYHEDNGEVGGGASSSTYSNNPFDYLNLWPIWNTPPEWCTSIGEGIMSNTVPVYINTISFDGDDDNDRSMSTEEKVGKRRVASFISDNRRRDVQTALAMMSGMAEEIAR